MARGTRFKRLRALAGAAAAKKARVVERVKRVYVAARGGVSRAGFVARNAAQRAGAILSGTTGRIVAMVVGVAAMVALIPLLRRVFKLDANPNAPLWIAAVFLGLSLVFWRWLAKPGLALAAAAVAGFVGGSELLGRFFTVNEPSPAMAGTAPPAALPDRVPTGAPIPTQRQGVTVGRPSVVSAG